MSKFDLQNLRKIEQKRKDTVFGFIRNDKSLVDNQIPNAITLIVVLFYGSGRDQFDPELKGKTMILSNDNTRVHFKDGYMESIYGKRIVDSGYHAWKFKMVKPGIRGGYLVIGLYRCSKENDFPVDNYWASGGGKGYGFAPVTAKITRDTDGCTRDKFGVVITAGDTIEMSVDFEQLSLCWKVNGTSHGKSHDIEKDRYRLAIYMAIEEKIVEIMD